VNRITIKYTACLAIGIMGLLIANKALFIHTHKLEDGRIVVHAHPYNKSGDSESPYKNHSHTKLELLFYQNSENLTVLGTPYFSFITVFTTWVYPFDNSTENNLTSIQAFLGRAPPLS